MDSNILDINEQSESELLASDSDSQQSVVVPRISNTLMSNVQLANDTHGLNIAKKFNDVDVRVEIHRQ